MYVSLADELPYYFEPVPVSAITPEIERACKSDDVQEEISFQDEYGYIDQSVALMLE